MSNYERRALHADCAVNQRVSRRCANIVGTRKREPARALASITNTWTLDKLPD